MIQIDRIRTDGGTQPRAAIDWEVAYDYGDLMAEGVKLPPVTVFYDGENYWLADGFHRIKGAESSDIETISADVIQGTLEDAQWFSFGANRAHGLMRTNEDKQRAVQAALAHPKCIGLSNVQIAKHVGVDEKTVRAWRDKMIATSELPKSTSRTGADGRTINTSNIGKSRAGAKEAVGSIPPRVERAMQECVARHAEPEAAPITAAPRVLPKLSSPPVFLKRSQDELDWQVDLKDTLHFIENSAVSVERAVELAKDFGIELEQIQAAEWFFQRLEDLYGVNCQASSNQPEPPKTARMLTGKRLGIMQNAHFQRVAEVVGAVAGYCGALETLKVDCATGISSTAEMTQWIRTLETSIVQLKNFKKRLEMAKYERGEQSRGIEYSGEGFKDSPNGATGVATVEDPDY